MQWVYHVSNVLVYLTFLRQNTMIWIWIGKWISFSLTKLHPTISLSEWASASHDLSQVERLSLSEIRDMDQWEESIYNIDQWELSACLCQRSDTRNITTIASEVFLVICVCINVHHHVHHHSVLSSSRPRSQVTSNWYNTVLSFY